MELLRLIYLFQTLSLTGFFCYGLVRHAGRRRPTDSDSFNKFILEKSVLCKWSGFWVNISTGNFQSC